MGTACTRRLRAALLTALILTIAACIVVPVWLFTDPPYGPPLLEALRGADRAQVRKTLGEPQQTKAGGRYWYYSDSRALLGVIAGHDSAAFEDYQWLGIHFDAGGHVDFVENAGLRDCLSNGLCFDGNAPRQLEALARAYRPGPDECLLILLLRRLPPPLNTGSVQYRVDGRAVGTVNSRTYLQLSHPPGEMKIAAYDLAIGTRCIGGDTLYIQAVKKKDFSWETGADLAPLGDAEGRAALAERRLALPD